MKAKLERYLRWLREGFRRAGACIPSRARLLYTPAPDACSPMSWIGTTPFRNWPSRRCFSPSRWSSITLRPRPVAARLLGKLDTDRPAVALGRTRSVDSLGAGFPDLRHTGPAGAADVPPRRAQRTFRLRRRFCGCGRACWRCSSPMSPSDCSGRFSSPRPISSGWRGRGSTMCGPMR